MDRNGERRRAWVLDGGMATELERRGFQVEGDRLFGTRMLGEGPESVAAVAAVHTAFLESGADIISTATYQASLDSLCQQLHCSVDNAKAVIRRAVDVAVEARDNFWNAQVMRAREEDGGEVSTNGCATSSEAPWRPKPLVAGSVGPYGATLYDGSEYSGWYADCVSVEALMAYHRPKLQCLVQQGVDLLALETIPACREGEALVQLLREFPSVKAWLSFSATSSTHTSHGEPFGDVVRSCLQLDAGKQLLAVGANCCDPRFVSGLLVSAAAGRTHRDVPFIAYSNSGESWTAEKKWFGKENCIPLASFVREWRSLGAEYIGGCCRVYPEDIEAVAAVLLTSDH